MNIKVLKLSFAITTSLLMIACGTDSKKESQKTAYSADLTCVELYQRDPN